jgi:hypothetical protein
VITLNRSKHHPAAESMMITPGSRIELTYPDCNLVESLAKLRRRRIRVYSVRDLLSDPLTPAEFLARAFIRRSRWLVSGYDIDRKSHRQFYLGSSAEHHCAGVLKVALYEPGSQRPTWPFPRSFGETRRERCLLADAIRAWSERDLHDLRLRIYADDLRLSRFAG